MTHISVLNVIGYDDYCNVSPRELLAKIALIGGIIALAVSALFYVNAFGYVPNEPYDITDDIVQCGHRLHSFNNCVFRNENQDNVFGLFP